MANFILYLASCALLLALSWRTSMGNPVPAPTILSGGKCAQCSSLSKTLMQNIRELLNNAEAHETLFSGVTCLDQHVEVHDQTQTVLACAPILTQNASCSSERKTTFSESECLGNVMEDLHHYTAVIQSYLLYLGSQELPNSTLATIQNLLNPTLVTIQNLMENCSLVATTQKDSPESMWPDSYFDSRIRMCKVMKGFYIRAITINRAMGYISSGDHKK